MCAARHDVVQVACGCAAHTVFAVLVVIARDVLNILKIVLFYLCNNDRHSDKINISQTQWQQQWRHPPKMSGIIIVHCSKKNRLKTVITVSIVARFATNIRWADHRLLC